MAPASMCTTLHVCSAHRFAPPPPTVDGCIVTALWLQRQEIYVRCTDRTHIWQQMRATYFTISHAQGYMYVFRLKTNYTRHPYWSSIKEQIRKQPDYAAHEHPHWEVCIISMNSKVMICNFNPMTYYFEWLHTQKNKLAHTMRTRSSPLGMRWAMNQPSHTPNLVLYLYNHKGARGAPIEVFFFSLCPHRTMDV
jgi:hypothetical protein